MVKADVTYKIKQSNGTVTNYKEKTLETDTYDEFLNMVENDMRKLREKLGRKIRLDVENFVRENGNNSKSGDMNAKEAISYIKGNKKEDLENFMSEDEERTTVIRAYKNKFNIEKESINNN